MKVSENLIENSLYKSEEEKNLILKDMYHVADSFLVNYIGLLLMYMQFGKNSQIKNLLVKNDITTNITAVKDTASDAQVSIKLGFEKKLFALGPAKEFLKILNEMKNGEPHLDPEKLKEILKKSKIKSGKASPKLVVSMMEFNLNKITVTEFAQNLFKYARTNMPDSDIVQLGQRSNILSAKPTIEQKHEIDNNTNSNNLTKFNNMSLVQIPTKNKYQKNVELATGVPEELQRKAYTDQIFGKFKREDLVDNGDLEKIALSYGMGPSIPLYKYALEKGKKEEFEFMTKIYLPPFVETVFEISKHPTVLSSDFFAQYLSKFNVEKVSKSFKTSDMGKWVVLLKNLIDAFNNGQNKGLLIEFIKAGYFDFIGYSLNRLGGASMFKPTSDVLSGNGTLAKEILPVYLKKMDSSFFDVYMGTSLREPSLQSIVNMNRLSTVYRALSQNFEQVERNKEIYTFIAQFLSKDEIDTISTWDSKFDTSVAMMLNAKTLKQNLAAAVGLEDEPETQKKRRI